MQLLSADFMGPLPESDVKGLKFILVFTDHFSKFVITLLIRNQTSRVLTHLTNWYFCTFGSPATFLSDNGMQFKAERFQKLLKDWGVNLAFTSCYHPQSNFTERMNHNIKSMLQCFHHNNHTAWPTYLSEFQFALNSVVHDTTRMSPAAIFFRRELQQPGDTAVMSGLPPVIADETDQVVTNMEKMAEKNKKLYDKT